MTDQEIFNMLCILHNETGKMPDTTERCAARKSISIALVAIGNELPSKKHRIVNLLNQFVPAYTVNEIMKSKVMQEI